MIASGEIGPGSKLPVESELAARFDVSRGTLREGVRALAAMGILETRQGSGTTVTTLEPSLLLEPLVFWVDLQHDNESEHLPTVRRALEVESAGAAAERASKTQVERLRTILDGAPSAIEAGDHEAAMEVDFAFHRELAEIAANPILAALLDALSQPTKRTRLWQSLHRSGRVVAAHQEHETIFEAVRAGDSHFARAAMYTHITQVLLGARGLT